MPESGVLITMEVITPVPESMEEEICFQSILYLTSSDQMDFVPSL